nr:gluconolactonase [Quercus suber]
MSIDKRSYSSIVERPWGTGNTRVPSDDPSGPCFILHDRAFTDICGDAPLLTLIEERHSKFAHEAGVYIRSTNKNYFTSNYQDGRKVDVSATDCNDFSTKTLDQIGDRLFNANGACNYLDQVLFCTQGTISGPSALVLLNPVSLATETLLDNFYGRPFNSVNDIVVHHPTGDVWFTDPTYGYQQGFRPPPQLPSQVYRFRPSTGQVWAVADGFVECNGLCFTPDYRKLYVTDTGATRAVGTEGNKIDPKKPSTIYEFEVKGETRLAHRTLFAYCVCGVPDGIKCDTQGNVYAGCGDGVHVWSPEGTLLGRIYTKTMVANFNFSPPGIWVFAEERLYLCKIEACGALAEVEGHGSAR